VVSAKSQGKNPKQPFPLFFLKHSLQNHEKEVSNDFRRRRISFKQKKEKL